MDKQTSSPEGPEQRLDGAAIFALATAAQEAALESSRERRRLRRRVFWWRLGALLLLVILIVGSVLRSTEMETNQPYIARIDVSGVIVDDRRRDALLKNIETDDAVKALVVRIDSPGGTTVGGEAIFESFRSVAAQKPVVAVLGEVAASAGYVAAIGADHIVARNNTLTGSIGVIVSTPNFAEALDKLGVTFVDQKSGALKAEPLPYKPVEQEVLDAQRVLVDDSFNWFLTLVRDRRSLGSSIIEQVSDGRVLTGRMALDLSLVDAMGGEPEAIEWLETEKGVASNLPIRTRTPQKENPGLVDHLLDEVMGWSGWTPTRFFLPDSPVLLSKVR